jgi:D-alanyl-D-alanine carboxypeptidase (penicillin-binding protein 5/6)
VHSRLLLFCGLAVLAVVATAPEAAAAAQSPAPSVAAPSAIVIDRVTGRVLYAKDVHRERPMASCTKIMTALLVVERRPDLSKYLVAPAGTGTASGIGLKPGDRITVKEALLALMVKSANDAAFVLACRVGGSQSGFVDLMNRRAAELGLHDTHFRNPTGSRRDAGHYSSVYDLARLGRYAMREPAFRDLVDRHRAVIRWSPGHEVPVISNNLLLTRDWADGIKCGNTPAAGYCLVGSGRPGLRSLVTATLGAPARDVDAIDQVALFEWASTLYENKAVVTESELVRRVPVGDGAKVDAVAQTALSQVVRSAATIVRKVTLPTSLRSAPPPGTVFGTAAYSADGVVLGTVKLVVAAPVPTPAPSPTSTPSPL